MRILVVSSYPPRPCGIGAYAAAQVERLKAEGHDVAVLSPPDGRGDIRVPFGWGRPFLTAARRGGGFERIIVHFQPGLYYPPGLQGAFSKIPTLLALLLLVRQRTQTEILVHEAHRPTRWRPDHELLGRAFARAFLLFHTDAERSAVERNYRIRVRARLVDHREGVVVRTPLARDEARRRLGLPSAGSLFLCAGFIHPAKAYERAVRAFADAGSPGQLVLVGSVRDATPPNLAYAAQLRDMTERTHGVRFVEGFGSDDHFDAWLAAADYVILPYTRAWSSGVLARARVIGTPAIVSGVGGLAEQAGPGDEVFHTDDDLRQLFGRYGSSGWRARATLRPDEAHRRSARPSASS